MSATATPEPRRPHKHLQPGEIKLDWIPVDWALTPLRGKKAYLPGWTTNPLTVSQIQKEIEEGRATGIGLLSGQFSNEYGLIWVDFDGPEGIEFVERIGGGPIAEIFPPTLTIASGKEGRMRMLFRVSNENIGRLPERATLKLGSAPFEMLWSSRQGAICGAHPETKGYRTTNHGGFEYAATLPELPDWLYAEIAKAYPSTKYRKRGVGATNFVNQNITINYDTDSKYHLESLIEDACEYLGAMNVERADDYHEWVRIGMALHQVDDSLLAAWIAWSAQSAAFEDGCCEAKWATFERLEGGPNPEGGCGLKTLKAIAKEDGYIDLGGHTAPSMEAVMQAVKSGIGLNDDEDEEDDDDYEEEQYGEGPEFSAPGGVDRSAPKKGRNPPSSQLADNMFPLLLRDGWRYDPQYENWLRYDASRGIWRKQSHREDFLHNVQFHLKMAELPGGYSTNLVHDVSLLLRGFLACDEWNEDTNKLAFANGVLELDSGEFSEHARDNFLTWGLDFSYDSRAEPGPIGDWLLRTQYGDEERVQVLRAWLRACLVGRGNEIQRFLEIIGPGGRGKSTFAGLCTALVGAGNFASSTLNQLEQSRFEVSALKDKRLTLINDSERYGGSAQILKALTGGDSLRYEEKLKPIGDPFIYAGLVIIVANEPIQTSDPTSGLSRRRLTIEFNRPLYDKGSEAKDMIKIDRGVVSGVWAQHLPGLANWVLAMGERDMRRYLLDTHELVPSLRKVKNEILLNSNNLIDWLQSEVVVAPDNVCAIGKKIPAAKDAQERYCNSNHHLYPSYAAYCEDTGSKPVGQRRFVALLLDCCKNQLQLGDVFQFSKQGRIYVKGLAVRASDQKFKSHATILPEGKEKE